MANSAQIVIVGPSRPLVVRPTLVVGPAERVVVHPVRIDPIVIAPTRAVLVEHLAPVTIEAPPRAVWDDRGWTQRRDAGRLVYEGQYRVRNMKTGQVVDFEGRIVERGREITPFVADPPPELRSHPKAACFHRTTGPWFQINWHRAARTADDALLYVERVLAEALSGNY